MENRILKIVFSLRYMLTALLITALCSNALPGVTIYDINVNTTHSPEYKKARFDRGKRCFLGDESPTFTNTGGYFGQYLRFHRRDNTFKEDSEYVSFRVDRDAFIYIAVDNSESVPSWLKTSEWREKFHRIKDSRETEYRVFLKSIGKDENIRLKGLGNAKASMYSVIINDRTSFPIKQKFMDMRVGFQVDPEPLYDSLQKYGYNYALNFFFGSQGKPWKDRSGDTHWVRDSTWYRKKLSAAEKRGIKLVPVIGMHNAAWHDADRNGVNDWKEIADRRNESYDLEINRIKRDKKTKETPYLGSLSFAYKEDGADKLFEDVLEDLHSLNRKSEISNTSQFIHVSFDELGTYWSGKVIPGGEQDAEENFFSKTDRDFIRRVLNRGYSVSEAFQILILDAIMRHVFQVKTVFGNNAKVIIWGDVFDPEHNGSPEHKYKTFLGEKAGFYGIADLPGLTEEEKKYFRENVILTPWNYFPTYPINSQNKYEPNNSFSYLSEKGFHFLYAVASPSPDYIQVMKKLVLSAHEHKDHNIGYNWTHWKKDVSEKKLNLMHKLSTYNQRLIEERSTKMPQKE